MEDVRIMVDYGWNCNDPCNVQTFLLFVLECAQFGVLNWGCVVKYGGHLFCPNEKGRRLVVTGQTKLSVLIRPPC
jgi:hypothetical protein